MSDVLINYLKAVLDWCGTEKTDGIFSFKPCFINLIKNNGRKINDYYFIVKSLYYIVESKSESESESKSKSKSKSKSILAFKYGANGGDTNKSDNNCLKGVVTEIKKIKLWNKNNFATKIIGIYAKKIKNAEEFDPEKLWKLSKEDINELVGITDEQITDKIKKSDITDKQITDIVNGIRKLDIPDDLIANIVNVIKKPVTSNEQIIDIVNGIKNPNIPDDQITNKVNIIINPNITVEQITDIITITYMVNEINKIVPELMTWFFGNLPKEFSRNLLTKKLKTFYRKAIKSSSKALRDPEKLVWQKLWLQSLLRMKMKQKIWFNCLKIL